MYTIISLVLGFVLALIIVAILVYSRILSALAGQGPLAKLIALVLFVLALFLSFLFSFAFVDKFLAQYDFSVDTYITTKQDLHIYEEITKNPQGKETGTLKSDTVLKVVKSKQKEKMTWVEGYILVDGKPEYITILIPKKLKIKENSDYFDFSEESSFFEDYYKLIDDENAPLLNKIQKEFLEELAKNGITIKSSSDKSEKESIKKSYFIIPKGGLINKAYKGFFELYGAKKSDEFFYIEKKDKRRFKKIVKKYYKELEKERIPYFERRK